ncbi:hypothetical protein D9M73_100290 [compost metagenome]
MEYREIPRSSAIVATRCLLSEPVTAASSVAHHQLRFRAIDVEFLTEYRTRRNRDIYRNLTRIAATINELKAANLNCKV